VRTALNAFVAETENSSPEEFRKKYNKLITGLQHDLGLMASTPIVSLAHEGVVNRRRKETP